MGLRYSNRLVISLGAIMVRCVVFSLTEVKGHLGQRGLLYKFLYGLHSSHSAHSPIHRPCFLSCASPFFLVHRSFSSVRILSSSPISSSYSSRAVPETVASTSDSLGIENISSSSGGVSLMSEASRALEALKSLHDFMLVVTEELLNCVRKCYTLLLDYELHAPQPG
ncbi:hypothetical protein GW17_00061838 [Ensete ventricosum]|nr:hypothetical protein GW17_00061838 [Ensete ventricosum]